MYKELNMNNLEYLEEEVETYEDYLELFDNMSTEIDIPEDNPDYLSVDMIVESIYGNNGMWTILNPWSHEILGPSKTYNTGVIEYFSSYVCLTDIEKEHMMKEAASMCEDIEYRIDTAADALEYSDDPNF